MDVNKIGLIVMIHKETDKVNLIALIILVLKNMKKIFLERGRPDTREK